MKKLKRKMNTRVNMADQMVLISIFLAILYWGLESFLSVFSPAEVSFYRELFGPNVSEMWMRLIVLCLFLIFGSHVQYTINKRKEIEKALKESEEKYRSILESIEEGYYEVDFDSNFKFINDSMGSILRYPKEKMVNVNYRQFMDEENADIAFEAFNQIFRTGKAIIDINLVIVRKDGERRFLEISANLITAENGKKTGFRGVARDVTDRYLAEQAKIVEKKCFSYSSF